MLGTKIELKSGQGFDQNLLNNTGQISINTALYKEFGVETQKDNDSNREMEILKPEEPKTVVFKGQLGVLAGAVTPKAKKPPKAGIKIEKNKMVEDFP